MSSRSISNFAKFTIGFLTIMVSFTFFTSITHAAKITSRTSSGPVTTESSKSTRPQDPPDLYCLTVKFSSVTHIERIGVKNPPGGALRFDVYLYAVNSCPGRVDGIYIVGTINETCPAQTIFNGPTTFTYTIPYLLYKGAGAGKEFIATASCWTLQNKVPVLSSLPTHVILNIDAAASYLDGQPGQDALAPGVAYNVM